MPFNSYAFLFGFAPLLLAGFYLSTRSQNGALARGWLLVASIGFYAYASALSLAILLPVVLADFAIARTIADIDESRARARLAWFFAGVALNIVFLCYFKYRNFF